MMIVSKRVTVGTAASLIVPPHNQGQQVKLLNAGAEIVRIGGTSSVGTAAFGLPRLPDNPNVTRNAFEFELDPVEEIWAVTATGTSEVNVWIQRK